MLVFEKEKNVNKYHYHDALNTFSALLDQGAEVFTKKMFRHSQSKTRESWSDMESARQDKKLFATNSRSRREAFNQESLQKKRRVFSVRSTAAERGMNPRSTPTG
jgi:hypothetical protein